MGLFRWGTSIATGGLVSGRSKKTKLLVESRRQTRLLQQQTRLMQNQALAQQQAPAQSQIDYPVFEVGDYVRSRSGAYGPGKPYIYGELISMKLGIGRVRQSSGRVCDRSLRDMEVVPGRERGR